MPVIWKTEQWPQDRKKVNFHPNPKEGQCQKCSNYCTIALISYASKVILRILQARLRQLCELKTSDVQAGFIKGRGTRDHIANICWTAKKKKKREREFQKNIYFCFNDCPKIFDCVYHKVIHIIKYCFLYYFLRNLWRIAINNLNVC